MKGQVGIKNTPNLTCDGNVMELDELNAQWYDPTYWTKIQEMTPQIDTLITEFNEKVGLV